MRAHERDFSPARASTQDYKLGEVGIVERENADYVPRLQILAEQHEPIGLRQVQGLYVVVHDAEPVVAGCLAQPHPRAAALDLKSFLRLAVRLRLYPASAMSRPFLLR
jgi:hypothetical protein